METKLLPVPFKVSDELLSRVKDLVRSVVYVPLTDGLKPSGITLSDMKSLLLVPPEVRSREVFKVRGICPVSNLSRLKAETVLLHPEVFFGNNGELLKIADTVFADTFLVVRDLTPFVDVIFDVFIYVADRDIYGYGFIS